MSTRDIWFSDFECFTHDWLAVFKRQSDGETIVAWNDPEYVADFIEAYRPVLCGFNYRDYDSWLLKAVLLGWEPEQVHHVSETIVTCDDRSQVWALFNGSYQTLPPVIDLFHDITPRKGLKELEAMMGMAIVESSVPFDIARPLTPAERDEVLHYCLHDVAATERLYDLRFNYLKSKTRLCEQSGVDPLTMLKHTNARVVSEVLGAVKMAGHPDETYEVPDNVDLTAIPAAVLNYVTKVNTHNCTDTNADSLEFMFHGCPTVVGLGGIHAAVPKYAETASDDRAILLQDIGSYYPSLIINNGYMSRAVADPSAYKQFYDMRMAAKADGDKETADAAKLVLNTTYGATKDGYNKLFDPMQATRVCLSGQLYILDLIEQMFQWIPESAGLQLIQLNTDGWVVSLPRKYVGGLQTVVDEWQKRTGFTVETDEVEKIVQRDVNNYVLRKVDGKVKAKGGTVACYDGADLFRRMPQIIRNNNTIIDAAVTAYLLDGTPIEDTINACDDIERFQIIAKAGRTFQKVIHVNGAFDDQYDMPYDVEVQRVNRVYATTDKELGGIFKVKVCESLDDGRGEDGEYLYGKEVGRSKIPLTPEHCFIDNEGNWSRIELTTLDRSWYVSLAKRKAHEFITRDKKEKELMAETQEPNNELQTEPEEKPKTAPKRRTKADAEPEPAVAPFKVRLLELQKAMAGIASKVSFDGVVSNINYEYADTQQYKAFLSSACCQLDLLFGLDLEVTFLGIVSPEGKTPTYAAQADGEVSISDVHSDEVAVYAISGFGANVQPGYCNGGAQTNALRNFILNNYLLDNKGREGDDQAFNAGADTKAYVSPESKAAIKQGIADEKSQKDAYATDLFAKALYEKVIEARKVEGYEDFGAEMLSKHFNEDGTPILKDGKSTMKKTLAVQGLTKAEEIIATAADAKAA